MGALSWPDWIGLVVFLLLYVGYAPVSALVLRRSINAQLGGLRVDWMRTMLRRDNRIVDSALIGHVVHSASFFASTSLIVIGALLSLLSGVERLQPAVEGLAFVPAVARVVFEVKIVLPLAVMVHGFVRFTWAIRQLNYTIALIGAAPDRNSVGGFLDRLAEGIGNVMTAALTTFNAGLRSYYYALAALGWIVGPWEMVIASVLLTSMLVWRQVASEGARSFQTALAVVQEAQETIRNK
jgi:uncharacterized membrane protein